MRPTSSFPKALAIAMLLLTFGATAWKHPPTALPESHAALDWEPDDPSIIKIGDLVCQFTKCIDDECYMTCKPASETNKPRPVQRKAAKPPTIAIETNETPSTPSYETPSSPSYSNTMATHPTTVESLVNAVVFTIELPFKVAMFAIVTVVRLPFKLLGLLFSHPKLLLLAALAFLLGGPLDNPVKSASRKAFACYFKECIPLLFENNLAMPINYQIALLNSWSVRIVGLFVTAMGEEGTMLAFQSMDSMQQDVLAVPLLAHLMQRRCSRSFNALRVMGSIIFDCQLLSSGDKTDFPVLGDFVRRRLCPTRQEELLEAMVEFSSGGESLTFDFVAAAIAVDMVLRQEKAREMGQSPFANDDQCEFYY